MDDGLVEAVVYAARKLHWSREQIGVLTPAQFSEIVEELRYQEAVERYETQYNLALVLAAIYTTIPQKHPKRYKPSDFLKTEPPMRRSEILKKKIAENKPDIKLPKYKLIKMEE